MSTPEKALEAFVVQPELAQLEGLLSRFNLFEAIGVVRHELRHSDFLSYLLDPSRNHGIEAIFLKELLQAVLLTTEGDSPVSLFDLDFWNLGQAVVQREWRHIDILVVDNINRFVIIIENKIDTSEHSGQLSRYYAVVCSHYPGYKILALYLTPDGDAPSLDRYLPVSYSLVCEVIENLVRDRRSTLGSEVVMLLEHYAQMLRRHILSESEVAELCRRIYQKHRQALDLIFEHRPDQQAQIGQYARSLIEKTDGIVFASAGKGWVAFGLEEWKTTLRHISNTVGIYFEFHNMPNELRLLCTVVSASQADKADREKLFLMAEKHHFTGRQSRLNKGHYRASIVHVLSADDYDKPQEEIEALISEKWAVYLRDDLPKMAQAIREEQWLWEAP